LDLAQYRELATFAQFGTADLDRATRAQLERGQRSTEILKQLQYQPMSLEKEVIVLYAVNNGDLDDIPVTRCQEFEEGLLRYVESTKPDVAQAISDSKDIDDDTEAALKTAIQEFKSTFNLTE
jgi:F-type H+-transporting ATPase subunit alpha